LHGIFDEAEFRADFLNGVRKKKALPLQKPVHVDITDHEFDKLAKLVRRNIDMRALKDIVMPTDKGSRDEISLAAAQR